MIKKLTLVGNSNKEIAAKVNELVEEVNQQELALGMVRELPKKEEWPKDGDTVWTFDDAGRCVSRDWPSFNVFFIDYSASNGIYKTEDEARDKVRELLRKGKDGK